MSDCTDEKCRRCGKYSAAGTRTCPECGARLPEPGPGKGAHKESRAARWFWLVPVASVAIFLWPGSVEGTVRTTGKPFGDGQRELSTCYSGDRQSFFGVSVKPDGRGFAETGGMKILKNDADQWVVYLERPLGCESAQCELTQVDRNACSTFDVEVRNSGTIANEIRVRRGHARLECRFPEGGSLKAELEFSGCG